MLWLRVVVLGIMLVFVAECGLSLTEENYISDLSFYQRHGVYRGFEIPEDLDTGSVNKRNIPKDLRNEEDVLKYMVLKNIKEPSSELVSEVNSELNRMSLYELIKNEGAVFDEHE